MEFRKLTQEESEKVFEAIGVEGSEFDSQVGIETKVGLFVLSVYLKEEMIADEKGVNGMFVLKCVTQILINKEGVAELILESDDILDRIW